MNEKIEICKKIYREAFNDGDTYFEDLLFENCSEYIVTKEENGIPVSMYFALPCILKNGDNIINAVYFYAAATDKNYRGRGYMGELIEELKKNEELIFLRPGEESLIEYYKKFSFNSSVSTNKSSNAEIIPKDGFLKLTEQIKTDLIYEDFVLMYYCESKFNFENINFPYSMF